MRYCLLTNDVETTSIWHNTLRDETGKLVLEEGMPILLDLYQAFNIKSTFFFTGYIAQKFPDVVKMIMPAGHEIGCHGLSHKVEHGFDVLSFKEQVRHLTESKKILEDISGQKVVTFRAPALRVNQDTSQALTETGFLYDSSVASQRFDAFLSFGGMNKLNWITAPRLPYRTSPESLFKKGDGQIIEIPLSAMGFPYVGTTMRIFPNISKFVRMVLAIETKINGKPIVFDIHPNEFLEEGAKQSKREIERRSKGYLSYLLKDLVRSKLKVRNLGKKAIPLYKEEIEYFKSKKFEFITIQDFAKRTVDK